LTSADECNDKADTYFECVDGAELTCNGNGEVVAQECWLQYLDAIGCAVSQNPNPDIVEPCADYCANVVATECPNNGTEEQCNTNCLWSGATGLGCSGEWATFLGCANEANWSCFLGYAVAEGCGADYVAYSQCINEAGG
jgi:hypothetical protein